MTKKKHGWVVKEGEKIHLRKVKTKVLALYRDEEDYKKQLESFRAELRDLQEKLFASNDYAVLIIFQGMDTSGKDGSIAHVMSGVNPQGVSVSSFKQPSQDELKHDFLWRTVAKLPQRGMIGIFNRSYYEDVLITRVHKKVLEAEMIPQDLKGHSDFWDFRLKDIRNHESYLGRQGTRVIKIFLHISKEEQRKRLKARLDDPDKMWKISESDFHERLYWDRYIAAYQDCLNQTSSDGSPWHIIPADDKKNARLMISKVLLSEIGALNIHCPKVKPSKLKRLKKLKKSL